MSEKRKTLDEVQQLAERLRLSGYGERTYEYHLPALSRQWRASGEKALAELMVVVAKALVSQGR